VLAIQRHRRPHVGGTEFIEQDDVGMCRERLFELRERFDFHLDRNFRRQPARAGDRSRDRSGGRDMVLLDEHHVIEPDAMILRATAEDSVLLCGTQPRQCFPRVEDLAAGTGNGGDEPARHRGSRRQKLEEVESRTLSGKHRASRAFDGENHLIRQDPVTIAGRPAQFDVGVQAPEDLLHPGPAAENRVLARDNPAAHLLGCRDQLGGNIATANVFTQGSGNLGVEIRGNVRHGGRVSLIRRIAPLNARF